MKTHLIGLAFKNTQIHPHNANLRRVFAFDVIAKRGDTILTFVTRTLEHTHTHSAEPDAARINT